MSCSSGPSPVSVWFKAVHPVNPPRCYIYLHGFASGPSSAKAVYLRDRFAALHLSLCCPDLNQADFYHLTLSRQIQQVETLFPPAPVPVTLIGSSLGGLTAAWIAQRQPQVDRLVLLAPAFQFRERWLEKLDPELVQSWQQQGEWGIYHYAEQRSLPLSYDFVRDLEQYDDRQLQRSLPTLILHGKQDEVIPLQSSRDYAATRAWVKLIELDSDHGLFNAKTEIWTAIQDFCF